MGRQSVATRSKGRSEGGTEPLRLEERMDVPSGTLSLPDWARSGVSQYVSSWHNIRISCRPSTKPGNAGLEPDSQI